jgi:hypothetical protein
MIARRSFTEVNLHDRVMYKTKLKSVSCEPTDIRTQIQFFRTIGDNLSLLNCGAESHQWSTLNVSYDPVDGCWVCITEATVEKR